MTLFCFLTGFTVLLFFSPACAGLRNLSHRTSAAWLVALLLASASAHAAVSAAAADNLMRRSGLSAQFPAIEPQVLAGVRATMVQQGLAVDDGRLAQVNDAAHKVFGADVLRNRVRDLMADDLQPQHVPALSTWFSGEQAQAFVKLDEAASSSKVNPTERVQQGEQLLQRLPKDRVARLERFVKASRAPEALTNTTINMLVANGLGAAMANPAVDTIDLGALRRIVEERRADMEAQLEGIALAVFAKTYESVSDADLDRYLAFLGTEAGKHYTDVWIRATDMAFDQATDDWPKQLLQAR